MIETQSANTWADWVYGFDTVQIMITCPIEAEAAKVRLYPRNH